MAVAFVVFQDHPDILDLINEQLNKAVSEIQGFSTNGCLAIALCGAAILSRYNSILGIIDSALGKLGIVKVKNIFNFFLLTYTYLSYSKGGGVCCKHN